MATTHDISHRKARERTRSPALEDRTRRPQPPDRALLGFYLDGVRDVFRHRPRAVVLFLVASVMHSFGHAALALSAARCAVILASSLWTHTTATSWSVPGIRTALLFGSLGLVAAIAKGVGGVVAAHGQATLTSRVGGTLRLEVLDDWFASYRLRRPRQSDHGQRGSPPPADAAEAGMIPPRTAASGVSALTARITDVETGLAQGLLGGGRALAQLLPILVALLWISPKLACAAFAVLAPFALLLSSSRRAWRRANRAAARDSEELLEAADESVRHADLWVAYSAEAKARRTVARLGDSLGQRAARIQATSAAMSGGNEVLAAIALLAALGAAQAGWLGDTGGGGELLGFTVCFFLAYRPLRDLTESRLAWSRAEVAFADLVRPIAPAPLAPSSPGPDPRRIWPLDDLRVDGLVLRHGTSAPITFIVPAGELVVLVGPTGEGKTTLLRTLLGLDVERAGEIRYGETRLRSAPPGLTHRPFAWVPQDGGLLADTLDANVALGDASNGDGSFDLETTLRPLGGEPLVAATKGKRLGPGGVILSGGERQWVALARALATTQPVLLLDEPTSGLDPRSQAAVLDAIARLRGRRSIVFVTHRPEPLALATTVVRFASGGVVVEDGPARRAQSPASSTEA